MAPAHCPEYKPWRLFVQELVLAAWRTPGMIETFRSSSNRVSTSTTPSLCVSNRCSSGALMPSTCAQRQVAKHCTYYKL